MRFSRQQAANALRSFARNKFRDFITDLPAHREIEFSACLAALHNWRRIDWEKVPLQQPSNSNLDQRVLANEVIMSDAVALCEYPLFFSDQPEELQWAEFRADILFCAKDMQKVVYVENKIGAGIRKDLIEGVMKCFEKYHAQGHFERASFILLTGREFIKNQWYLNELKEVLARVRPANVSAHIMYWEDVLNACAAA